MSEFAGDRLLERVPSVEEVRRWTEQIARTGGEAENQTLLSVLIFRVGEETLAMETVEFHEVVEMGPVHRVPHRSGRLLRGLVNIRGRLELCVSLGPLLGSEPARQELFPNRQVHLLVLGGEGDKFAFPVSEVLGIQKVRSDDLESAQGGSHLRSVFAWKGHSVGLLDAARLRKTLTERVCR